MDKPAAHRGTGGHQQSQEAQGEQTSQGCSPADTNPWQPIARLSSSPAAPPARCQQALPLIWGHKDGAWETELVQITQTTTGSV